MTKYSRFMVLLFGIFIVVGRISESCPICSEIVIEKKRVDAGLVITNYDSSASFLMAMKANGDSVLEQSARRLVDLYKSEGQTSVCAVALYMPPMFEQFVHKHSEQHPVEPSAYGSWLLGTCTSGGVSLHLKGLYDAPHHALIPVGPEDLVSAIVWQYTNSMPRWMHDLQCQKHPVTSLLEATEGGEQGK